jgi:hypothetical protein
MKFILFLPILFLTMHVSLHAQQDTTLNFVPERPGMATPPEVMTVKHFQIETGGQFEKTGEGNLSNHTFFFPSLLLRYGVAKPFELRAQTDYLLNSVTDTAGTTRLSGLNPITISGKIKLFEQKRVLPNVSLLLNLTLPFLGNKNFRPEKFAPSIYLLLSNDVSEKLNMAYNYGLSWDGNSSVPEHFYALCFGIILNEKTSCFIESYGTFARSSDPGFFADTGLAFLITERFQVDVSTGFNLKSFPKDFFINTGFAWFLP